MPKYSDYREYETYRDVLNEERLQKYNDGIRTYESDLPVSHSKWLTMQKDAVVKGELVSREVNSDRKVILNRYAMRNGHNSQMPDESREDFNLRVHGLREEDFE